MLTPRWRVFRLSRRSFRRWDEPRPLPPLRLPLGRGRLPPPAGRLRFGSGPPWDGRGPLPGGVPPGPPRERSPPFRRRERLRSPRGPDPPPGPGPPCGPDPPAGRGGTARLPSSGPESIGLESSGRGPSPAGRGPLRDLRRRGLPAAGSGFAVNATPEVSREPRLGAMSAVPTCSVRGGTSVRLRPHEPQGNTIRPCVHALGWGPCPSRQGRGWIQAVRPAMLSRSSSASPERPTQGAPGPRTAPGNQDRRQGHVGFPR